MCLEARNSSKEATMANSMTDRFLDNNKQYASGQAVHKPAYPTPQSIYSVRRFSGSVAAIVSRCDAIISVSMSEGATAFTVMPWFSRRAA